MLKWDCCCVHLSHFPSIVDSFEPSNFDICFTIVTKILKYTILYQHEELLCCFFVFDKGVRARSVLTVMEDLKLSAQCWEVRKWCHEAHSALSAVQTWCFRLFTNPTQSYSRLVWSPPLQLPNSQQPRLSAASVPAVYSALPQSSALLCSLEHVGLAQLQLCLATHSHSAHVYNVLCFPLGYPPPPAPPLPTPAPTFTLHAGHGGKLIFTK